MLPGRRSSQASAVIYSPPVFPTRAGSPPLLAQSESMLGKDNVPDVGQRTGCSRDTKLSSANLRPAKESIHRAESRSGSGLDGEQESYTRQQLTQMNTTPAPDIRVDPSPLPSSRTVPKN